PFEPAWYRYLLPLEANDWVTGWSVEQRGSRGIPGRSVLVSAEFQMAPEDEPCGVSWSVDENGAYDAERMTVGDLYYKSREQHADRYPDPHTIRLGPLPPGGQASSTSR
ncbi:MAG TPA: hypothetical protein P5572_22260, partial [Phycisphaerae bacterium]|nr:hypothetical protein [Phycisphaerae bacterium]